RIAFSSSAQYLRTGMPLDTLVYVTRLPSSPSVLTGSDGPCHVGGWRYLSSSACAVAIPAASTSVFGSAPGSVGLVPPSPLQETRATASAAAATMPTTGRSLRVIMILPLV